MGLSGRQSGQNAWALGTDWPALEPIHGQPKAVDAAAEFLLNYPRSAAATGGKATIKEEDTMDMQSLIILLVIGAIAGWLAGQIMKGGGFGLIGDIIVGIVGAFIGSWLWGWLHLPGIGPWWLTAIISATIGACILLFIIRLVKRA
jgi:uncharacterized membrane protein YeaQ/YmgE (transglycosylase-associated protein family)